MMKFGLLLFAAVLALAQAKALEAPNSIQVQLYYESFCPGSTEFITEQFHKTYQTLGSSLIKLEMIPVAREAEFANGTKQFYCQHGEKECYGNKVHGCALVLNPIEVAEAYIHCLHKTGGSADPKLLKQVKALDARDSIQVQLYYESFSPGSTEFITEQLHKAYQALGSSMIKLEMIPVAKETVLPNGTKRFICQHGEKECYGNKVHGCALALYPIEIAETFIYCLHKTGGSANPKLIKKCAEDVKISYNDIEVCMSSGRGDYLFSANVEKTKAARHFLKFLPTVVFDGKYSSEDATAVLTDDFQIIVCTKLGHPDKCEKK